MKPSPKMERALAIKERMKRAAKPVFKKMDFDLEPCKNCGRIAYVGICCNNPKRD